MTEISSLHTEQRNIESSDIDRMTSLEIAELMNCCDRSIPYAVEKALPEIAEAITSAETVLRNGGRVIYIGAGTSGRLGVLDASECPPTFGVSPDSVVGIIAGGQTALTEAVEGAEDDAGQAEKDLKQHELTEKDFVVGISASGRTPYVAGGLIYAKSLGCRTAAVSCVNGSNIGEIADISIEADTGPEVITGSTRLRAGTAQKMILNMISTGSMVRIGKTYRNLMVDLVPKNEKLRLRCVKILCEAASLSVEQAEIRLKEAKGNLKAAIVMSMNNCSLEMAESLLRENDNKIAGSELQEKREENNET